MTAERRFANAERLKCANSGHCATALRTGRIDAIGLSGVFSQARIPDAERGRAGSPRVSRAKCSSNAVSLLALRGADRELIVDVGEDRDVCVDPSRQAAAKLKHGRLIHQRHAVRPRKDGVGLSPPIAPKIAPQIRLPDLTASG